MAKDIRIIPSSGQINVTGSADFRGAGNSSVLFVTGSGGIGINTTDPSDDLHVAGTFRATSVTGHRIGNGTDITKALSILDTGMTAGDTNVVSLGRNAANNNQAEITFHLVQTGSTSNRLQLGLYNSNDTVNILGSGRVGIGTVSPAQKLHVVGAQVRLDSNTGGYYQYDTSGTFRFALYDQGSVTSLYGDGDGSNPAISINSGRVGIGTVSPGEKLHVKGDVRAEDGANTSGTVRNKGYLLWADDAFGMQLHHDGSSWGTAVFARSYDSDVRLGHYNTDVTAQNEFTSSLVVKYTGKVGIGTTNPSTKLHLYEASGSDVIFRLTPEVGAYDPIIQFTGQGNNIADEGFEIWYDNSVGDVHLSTTYPSDNAAIRFHTRTGASKSTSNERMTISGAGSVGIGTTAPVAKLDVRTTTGTALLLRNGDNLTGTANRVQIQFAYQGLDDYSHYITSRHNSGAATGNALDFYVGDTTSNGSYPTNAVHNLTLEAGNVGIGVTNPTSTLHIDGAGANTGTTSVSNPSGTLRVGLAGGFNSNDVGASLVFTQEWFNGSSAQIAMGQITGYKQSGNGNYGGGLTFWTANENTNALAERMRIDKSGTVTVHNDLTVDGIVTAKEFHTTFVSASIIYQSGSTKFGDTADDIHQFTGSIIQSGGTTTVADKLYLTNVASSGQDGILAFDSTNTSGGSRIFSFTRGGSNELKYHSYGYHRWYSGPASGTGDSTARMTLNSDGNLGIGVASPSRNLHVNEDLRVDGGRFYLYNTSHGSWDDGVIIDDATGWAATIYRRSDSPKMFTGLRSGTDNFIWMSPIYDNSSTTITAPRTDAILEVKEATDSLEIYLPTAFGQNVGIGRVNAAAKLHISSSSSGAIKIETESSGESTPQLFIEGNKAGSAPAAATLIELKSNNDYRGRGTVYTNATDSKQWFTGVPYTGGKFTIGFDDTSGIPYYPVSASITILENGNVGIGTTNPNNKLHVQEGDIRIDDPNNGTIRGLFIRHTGVTGNVTSLVQDTSSTPRTLLRSSERSLWIQAASEGSAPTSDLRLYANQTLGLTVSSSGQIKLSQYGSGNFTANSVYRLAVDADGNVIEESLGDGSINGLGASRYIARWVDTDSLTTSSLYEDGNGNIGIGTTTPSGPLVVKGAGGNGTIRIVPTSANGEASIGYYQDTAGTTATTRWVAGVGGWGNTNKFTIGYGNGGSDLTIDTAGNVGVGTTSPSSILHIKEDTSTVYDATAYQKDFIIERKNTSGNNQSAHIRFLVTGYEGQTTGEASIGVIQTSNASSGHTVFTNRHNGTRSETLRIQSDGNVGIGTTAPSKKLHVAGDAYLQSGNLFLTQGKYITWNSGDNYIKGLSGYHIQFTTYDGVSAQNEVLRMTGGSEASGGARVGIGTTTPSAKLEVYRSGSTVLDIQGSQGQLFSVTDELSGSLMSVNDISGIPILEVFSDDRLVAGTFGANTLVVDGSSVGIGTNAPANTLHVQNSGNGAVVRVTNSQNTFYLGNDTNGGYLQPASTGMAMYGPNGSKYVYVDNSGVGINTRSVTHTLTVNGTFKSAGITDNADATAITINGNEEVGIGTGSPFAKLHVYGGGNTIFEGPASTDIDIRYRSNGTNKYNMFYQASTDGWGLYYNPGSAYRLFVSGSGNVGIGTNTPGYKLQVAGTTKLDDDVYFFNTVLNPASNFASQRGAGFDASSGKFEIAASEIPLEISRFSTTGPVLSVRHSGSQVATIDTDGGAWFSGCVGIGTTSPREKLEVVGSIYAGIAGNNSAITPALIVSASGTGTGQASAVIQQARSEGDTLIFSDYGPYVEYNFMHENASNEFRIYGGSSTNSLGSDTFYNTAGTARTGYKKWVVNQLTGNMYTAGNIGVKTVTPAKSLDVDGDAIIRDGLVIKYSDDTGEVNDPYAPLLVNGPVASSITYDEENTTATLVLRGNADNVNLQFGTGDINIGPYGGWIQASYDNVATSGSEPLLLNPIGGNVGIGTTKNATDLLQIYGNAKYVSAKNTSGNIAALMGADSSGDGNFALYQSAGGAAKIKLYAESNADSYINAGGNLGVGTGTPNKGRLHVYKGSATNHIALDGGDSYSKVYMGNFLGGLYLSTNYYYQGGQFQDTSSQRSMEINMDTDFIAFNTMPAGSPGSRTKVLYISGSQNRVGVNTDTPEYTFHVNASSIKPTADLLLGEAAYSTSNAFIGLKTTYMTGINDYMIISGKSDFNTYISAKDNAGVFIRGGGNRSSNQIFIPDDNYINIDTTALYVNGALDVDNGVTIGGDLTVDGIVTAKEFHTTFVSASIIYQSGSNKFGDTVDDLHSFTGSVDILTSTFAGNRSFIISGSAGPRLQRRGDTSGWAYEYGFNSNNGVDQGGFGALGNETSLTRYYVGKYGAEHITILNNGNVGIGKTSPGKKLHVAGDILIEDSSPSIQLLDTTYNADGYIYLNDDGSLSISADENNERAGSKVLFYVDGGEKGRIDSNGALQVTGNIKGGNDAGIYSFNDTVNASSSEGIFTIANNHGAQAFRVTFVCSTSGYSVAKTYEVVHSFGNDPIFFKVVDTGGYGAHDFDVAFTDDVSNTGVRCTITNNSTSINANIVTTVFLGGSPTDITVTAL